MNPALEAAIYTPRERELFAWFRRPTMPTAQAASDRVAGDSVQTSARPRAQAASGRAASDSATNLARFAWFTRIHSLAKPVVFQDLAGLCDRIHRDRAGRGIELQDCPLLFRQGETPFDGVSIWIRTDDGMRGDFLGYAWADGRKRQALEAALYARQPVAVHDTAFDDEAA